MSMFGSVVHDLKGVLMPNLLHILLIFSVMPGACGILAVPVGFSRAV